MIAGQRISVSAPGRGRCLGRVDAVLMPEELPRILEADLPSQVAGYADSAAAVREILGELHITRVAWITYTAADAELTFCALEVRGQDWRDLRGQALTIEALP